MVDTNECDIIRKAEFSGTYSPNQSPEIRDIIRAFDHSSSLKLRWDWADPRWHWE